MALVEGAEVEAEAPGECRSESAIGATCRPRALIEYLANEEDHDVGHVVRFGRIGTRHANIGVSGECERLGEVSLDERLVMRLGPRRINSRVSPERFQPILIFKARRLIDIITFDQGATS